MCGIVGVFEQNGPNRVVLQKMTDALAHRGPDDSGVWSQGPAGLGHRRLSIIDLSPLGKQPMCNEDETVWVAFNGEIYNFEALRDELLRRGHKFRSKTDTEVIPHAYEEYGERCLDKFRGMFAFVLWDAKKKILFAARDRFGIKPLFFYHDGKRFACASEIKALLAHPDIPRAANREAMRDYMLLRYVRAPATFFKGIQNLRPGHFLRVSERGLETVRYWTPPLPNGMSLSAHDAAEKYFSEFKEAVKLHLISDVPLGVFLSGGLDSSTLAAVAAGFSRDPLRTFTVGFPNSQAHDERPFARVVAKHLGSRHTEIEVSPDASRDLRIVTRSVESPISNPAMLANYLIAKEARKSVTVVLSGEGADETHGGYEKYRLHAVAASFDRLPAAVRAPMRSLACAVPGGGGRRLRWALSDFETRTAVPRYEPLEKMIGVPLWTRPESAAADPFLELVAGTDGAAALARMFQSDILGWMEEDSLVKMDRTTMAHGLEARVPYLDHPAAEVALRMDPVLKVSWFKTKKILRAIAARVLPSEIAGRRQHGFNVPIGDWYRKNLTGDVAAVLDPARVAKRGYFRADFIKGALELHRSGKADASLVLWMIAAVETWHEEFGVE